MKSFSAYLFFAVNVASFAYAVQPPWRGRSPTPPPSILASAVATPQHVVAAAPPEVGRLKTRAGATLPALRSLSADGVNFAGVGCKVTDKGPKMPPYGQFMPACMKHMRQLIAEIDGSYTDIQLEMVLEHECSLEKRFPKSCDSGFDKMKHCRAFATQLVEARDQELQSGSKAGFHQACQDYFVLKGGIMPGQKLERFSGDEAPMFDKESMPPVSTTLHCIINLALQYFLVFTCLAIVRTMNSFDFKLDGIQQILETGCTTVAYAPMLCVLFLGARMRAIQLSQGETEKYQLPQPWVQTSMKIASWAVVAQVVLVLLVGVFSGTGSVTTDEEGNINVDEMKGNPVAVKLVTIGRYIVMAMLYGGFTAVVIGVFTMKGPKELWGNQQIPVSPAVMCTILLSGIFFLVYLLVAIVKTIFEINTSARPSETLLRLENGASAAKMTVNFAPMLSILFIGARMRALQIDPMNGSPQTWAQKCMFLCTFSILVQALLVILMPFLARGKCKRGKFEGDISLKDAKSPGVGKAMTAVRYICLLALYGGIGAVIYSVYAIKHPDGRSKTPPVSPAMHCVITLTVQYFLIYIMLFGILTIKSFSGGARDADETNEEAGAVALRDEDRPTPKVIDKAVAIFDAARSTVMFAPMLSILFIGARMRALQLTKAKNGTIPPGAGPQKWVQDGMFLATWSVFVQLIMTMLVPMVAGSRAAEVNTDGSVKVPKGTHKCLAVSVEVVRYLSLLCMFGGACVVMYGVFTMTPDSLPPYNEDRLIPGVAVPKPPDMKAAEGQVKMWLSF